MLETIASITRRFATGELKSSSLTEEALERALDPNGEGERVFLCIDCESARQEASGADALRAAGVDLSPIAGITVSLKDLFDVAGQQTRAGSVALDEAPVAKRDSTVVARLKRAGAVIVGRTNMTEFAYSGIGMNPHYGTPLNPWQRWRRLIPGGSSSGAAVSVTDRMAVAAIGSDTGGSVRIPAALCGITGFKATQRRIPLDGVFPLCTSQDSVGVMAPSVACCAAVDAVLAGEAPWEVVAADLGSVVLAVPRNSFLDGLDATVARAFERSLAAISSAGARIVEVTIPEVTAIGEVNVNGGLVAAESFAIHRRLGADLAKYDPLVSERVLRGAKIGAADYLDMLHTRASVIEEFDRKQAAIDAILCPVTPIVAPEISALESSAAEYRRMNGVLLRNTHIVNFLDRCALSLPCHQEDEAPVGLMLIGRTGGDHALLRIGAAIEKCLR